MTVSEFLARWKPHHEQAVRPSTWKRYDTLLKLHVEPNIGMVRLSHLRPAHVATFINEMQAKGSAASTITQAKAVLGKALKQAIGWGLITTNAAQAIPRPKAEAPQLVIPSKDDLLALIDAAQGTPWEIPIVIAATTGMRRGEVLGAQWADLDLATGRLQVRRAVQRINGKTEFVKPKTDRAIRQVTIPMFVIERLKKHKVDQTQRRLALGEVWQGNDLIADHGDGTPLSPDGFTQGFKRIAIGAGLDPKMRLHDVRHGVATMMLQEDVHMAIASAVLGHADPAFTMRTYQHMTDGMSDSAASAIGNAFTRSS